MIRVTRIPVTVSPAHFIDSFVISVEFYESQKMQF